MSEVPTKCPECGFYHVETKIVHNPDTIDMNAKATSHEGGPSSGILDLVMPGG